MLQPPLGLAEAKAALWAELKRAAADKQHAWRTPVLATVNGQAADARTVILREVDAPNNELRFYTDERGAKVSQLRRHPLGTLLMWSPTLSWQLRCRVVLSVDMAGLAATSRWARIMLTPAAQDYLALRPPGTPLEPAGDAPNPSPAQPVHFAVVTAQVLSMDWLELNRAGHRRALIDDQGARWIEP